MWLDRLASQSSASGASSQPPSRPYSPAPRRSTSSTGPYITSHRPAQPQARGSSLSLVSNDSSTSPLSSSARKANGSNLKQSHTAYDGPDPVDTLAKILGTAAAGGDAADPSSFATSITADDLSLEYDFGGLALSEFMQAAADDAQPARNTGRPQHQTVEEHQSAKAKFEDLHRSIDACDGVLDSVESNLSSFRDDLAAVSADIETLQSRSTTLNIRLENRKAVEKALGPVVDELSVSPVVVTKITQGEIDESWVKTLNDIDRRMAAYKKNTSGTRQNKAWSDLGPLLDKLITKAIERIRDFIVAQIKALRSPNINAQIIQQQKFLKFKELYAFLHRHHATLAEEICQAYMNTMRWYYLNQFTRYENALGKLKLHHLDKSDVIGLEDSSRKASVLSAARPAGPPHDAFNIGRRVDLIHTGSQAAISSYLAEEDSSTHYLEVPFRNFSLALIDNATAEYSFMAAYFSPPLSMGVVGKNFSYIFEPTFALGQNLTKHLVADSYDALGLLLSIRINQHLAFELQRRRTPAMDGYINGTNMLLWPRLQKVMDHHCESLRHLTTALPSKPVKAEQAKLSAAPHLMTQRFGQLLQGILALSADAGDDEPVVVSLHRLRSELESFLTKLGQTYSDQRKRDRFLYNNYSLVATIISDCIGKLAEEQQDHFGELKETYSGGS